MAIEILSVALLNDLFALNKDDHYLKFNILSQFCEVY